MSGSTRRKPGSSSRRESQARRRSWCCSFTVPPSSPENLSLSLSRSHSHPKTLSSKPTNSSVPNSPLSTKSGLSLVGRTRIDPRRILSPGRVSPIDSDPTVHSIIQEEQENPEEIITVVDSSVPDPKPETFRAPLEISDKEATVFDVRLNLREKTGCGCLVLELNSQVLSTSSKVFTGLINEFKRNGSSSSSKMFG